MSVSLKYKIVIVSLLSQNYKYKLLKKETSIRQLSFFWLVEVHLHQKI